MQEVLKHNNLDLMREIKGLQDALGSVTNCVPEQLSGYYQWILSECEVLKNQISNNLLDLSCGMEETFVDILSNTQRIARHFNLINSRWASPILRINKNDSLCLKILRWLHTVHPETAAIPAGVSDGEFSIMPDLRYPVIYYMPSSSQRGLLYLPLFFHEFGHLLYACHKREMDE